MAVYTDVSDDELRDFVALYDIGDVISCKGIAEGIENTNYLIRTTRDGFILTLYEKRVERKDLPFFLGLMEHLASKGVACPVPVRARDGEAQRTLCGRPAAIVTFLDGMWPRRVTPAHCAALGETMARMHVAGGDFGLSRPNTLSVGGWRRLFDDTKVRADEVADGLAGELAAEIDFMEAHWPGALEKGIIHADLFPDNVFFLGDTLSGFIDFYFACSDLLAYDLAICLNAWCFEADGSFNITRAGHMLAAYRAVRPLSDGELDALPLLARGAALRFLLTRLYDRFNQPVGPLVKPKDPLEYLQKLRFHRGLKGRGAYGLE